MLKTRILSAAVLGAVLLGVLFWMPPLYWLAAITLTLLLGAWEWSGFMRPSGPVPRFAYVALVGLLLAAGWRASETTRSLQWLLAIAAVWWIFALVWLSLMPRRVSGMAAGLAGLLVLVPAWIALARMRMDWPRGAEWTLFLLLLVWAADIGAYFTGRRFGRRKLAPQVSPGKTWEGAAGGVIFAAALAAGGAWWFSLAAVPLVLLCVAAAAFSIVGDLTESMLKRFAGLKDSSSLIPGHGGVMDRIDSITAAAPVLTLGLPYVLSLTVFNQAVLHHVLAAAATGGSP